MQEKISMDAAHDFEAKMPLSRKIPDLCRPHTVDLIR